MSGLLLRSRTIFGLNGSIGVYLKDVNSWDYSPNVGANWYQKKICETKDKLKVLYTKQ